MNLYLPWTTTQEKKSISTNNSPGRTVRLNTALNTALIKKRIKSDTRDKCNTDTQQTQAVVQIKKKRCVLHKMYRST